MLELLAISPDRGFDPRTKPILGFNFDKSQSTSEPTPTTWSGGSLVTIGAGSPLAGYTNSHRSLNTKHLVRPLENMYSIGTGDFTVEFWYYASAIPENYMTLFASPNQGGSKNLVIQYANSTYGYRLQFTTSPGDVNSIYSVPLNRSNSLGSWRHVAMVRKSGRVRVFINGVQQALARGTSTQYNILEFSSSTDLSGPIADLYLANGAATAWDIYMPEFCVYNTAKYWSSGFTPAGPLVI